VRNLKEGNHRRQANNCGTGGNDDRKTIDAPLFINPPKNKYAKQQYENLIL